ncbi:MAG: FAD-binding oxidoreductase [Alphaproteobacteria bacterium]|nr:FAD-binding oxidoreductase [Alphaproteobacteria bacterium]
MNNADVHPHNAQIPHHAAHSIPTAPDLLIVGGGIVGLWCALKASRLGLETVLVDKGRIGQGASGGFLGALMPHQPVSWTDIKAFQLDALMSLETEAEWLKSETGIDCAYLRCGRLIPTQTQKKYAERLAWQAAAKQNWPTHSPTGAPIAWNILNDTPDPGWLSSKLAPLGCEFDTMSARINPRRLIEALRKVADATVGIFEMSPVTDLGDGTCVTLANGTKLTPGRVILTAGYQSFELLQPVTGKVLGRGVKGQAALLQPRNPIDPAAPILYRGGVYVIAHESGRIAVGSTSETEFENPFEPTAKLDDIIERATQLCPALEQAEIIERWAGVRPNAVGRQPIIGALPEVPRIVVASGGFKISFGIAHKMADAALGFITGETPSLPVNFKVETHYSRVK